jgi:UDP-N-acetylglucosamine transferase subunit ALG13
MGVPEGGRAEVALRGHDPVILVTIGTSDPFDRLLAAVARLPADEEIVAQCGTSAVHPENARCVTFLPFDELSALVCTARVVIMHAGAGSVLTALAAGRRPVAVPRLRRYGEAVDDHQVEFGRSLAAAGLITLVEDPGHLAGAIAAAPAAPPGRDGDGRLARDIGTYLRGQLQPAPSGPA